MATVYRFRFRVRRRTTANWVSSNEVLLDSEIGRESDLLQRSKMGNGVDGWNDLPFYTAGLVDHTALASIADGDVLAWDSGAGRFVPTAAGGGGGGSSAAMQFDADTGSTADSDPGNGLLKWNNATQASATVIYLDDQTSDGTSVLALWPELRAGGFMYLQHATDQDTFQIWEVTSIVDATGYVKLTATILANGGSFADGDPMLVTLQSGRANTTDVRFAASSRILARKTAGAGAGEECTLSEVLDFIGSAAQGDILYRDASAWARLGAGTSGQLLKTLGAGANPTWATVAGVSGGMDFIQTAAVAGAAATTITMSGLDLATDQTYLLVCNLQSAGSTANVSLYFNGDTTAGNYRRSSITLNGGSVTGGTASDGVVTVVLTPSGCSVAYILVTTGLDGKPTAISLMNRPQAAAGTPVFQIYATNWATAANVTGITLSASVASSLAIGSFFKAFRIKS
jgi:hypothetical protein